MGIPATIEFLSSLRNSLQLLVIKNNKNNSKDVQENKIKIYSKYLYEHIKTSV